MKRTKITALLLALTLCLACFSACGLFMDDGGFDFRESDDGEGYLVVGIDDESTEDVVIPSTYNNKPVTGIGVSAFHDCSSIVSVTIPDSVKTIGDSAFLGCDNLTNITIPDSVKSIGDGAFKNCYALTSMTLPSSVTSIGGEAFSGCDALTEITIPESITKIGDGAFNGCTSLQYSEHSNGKYLGNSGNPHLVLWEAIDVNVSSFAIPSGTKIICSEAFHDCYDLTSVTIPDSVVSIGGLAFWYCQSLKSITIPESVISIDYSAFFDGITIKYTGTKAQFKEIETTGSAVVADDYWTSNYTVQCSDGTLE